MSSPIGIPVKVTSFYYDPRHGLEHGLDLDLEHGLEQDLEQELEQDPL